MSELDRMKAIVFNCISTNANPGIVSSREIIWKGIRFVGQFKQGTLYSPVHCCSMFAASKMRKGVRGKQYYRIHK
jgi:hypothetical protein